MQWAVCSALADTISPPPPEQHSVGADDQTMKTPHSLLLSLGILLLGAGCAGTGPNTQQGAVAGGALGAVAGAIIGNNSGSHNSVAGALIGGAAGAVAGGGIGNSLDHQRGTIYTSESQATTDYAVAAPPPPPAPVREV